MNKLAAAAIATTFFATGISANDIYHGLGDGNSDISNQWISATDFVGVQPGIGDSIDRYHGLADGNSDLFKVDHGGPVGSGDDPDVYQGLNGNPDLHY